MIDENSDSVCGFFKACNSFPISAPTSSSDASLAASDMPFSLKYIRSAYCIALTSNLDQLLLHSSYLLKQILQLSDTLAFPALVTRRPNANVSWLDVPAVCWFTAISVPLFGSRPMFLQSFISFSIGSENDIRQVGSSLIYAILHWDWTTDFHFLPWCIL